MPEDIPVDVPVGGPASDLKFSFPVYEVERVYFDRRDDSLKVRKVSRQLDTFRHVPPEEEDIERIAQRHGARYVMVPTLAGGVYVKGQTRWYDVYPQSRTVGAESRIHQRHGDEDERDAPVTRSEFRRLLRSDLRRRSRFDPARANAPRRIRRERARESGPSKDALYQQMLERERDYQETLRQRDRELMDERYKRLEEKLDARATPEPADDAEEDEEAAGFMLLLKNPDVRDRIADKVSSFISETPREKHWAVELAALAFDNKEVVKEMVFPTLARFLAPPQPQPQPAATPRVREMRRDPTPTAEPAEPPQPQQQPPVADVQQSVLVAVGQIVEDLAANRSAERGARAVAEVRRQFPEVETFLTPLLEDPKTALDQIGSLSPVYALACEKPHAPKYMARLQERVKELTGGGEVKQAAAAQS
ncbi:MAG TPA: hypothetical protein VEQ42_06875 [Pyrinomonadaceae bacterium]|nr:hypothetical protein [Pyrinomonadaceae bacterium]